MRRIFLVALAPLLLLAAPAFAGAENSSNCREKEEAIQRKIEEARHAKNSVGRIRGLEKALENTRKWCSEDSLRAKAAMEVFDKQEKVYERERELEEAIAEERSADKLTKRRSKLKEARQELIEAEARRDALDK